MRDSERVVCMCVCTMCQTQCLLGVWGGATDWPHWLAFYAFKIWVTCVHTHTHTHARARTHKHTLTHTHTHTHTHTPNNGGYDCGSTETRHSQDSEQSIHTSRVKQYGLGHKEVSLPYACFTEEKEKDQLHHATLKESLTSWQFH